MIRRTMAALVLMLLALGPGGAAGARAAPGDDAWAALRTRVPHGRAYARVGSVTEGSPLVGSLCLTQPP